MLPQMLEYIYEVYGPIYSAHGMTQPRLCRHKIWSQSEAQRIWTAATRDESRSQ